MKRASLYITAGAFFLAVALKLAMPMLKPSEAKADKSSAPATVSGTVTYTAEEYQANVGSSRLKDWSVPTGLEAEQEAAVATFLSSQAAYDDLVIPANVSYAVPEMSFKCCTPLAGTVSSSFGYRVHPLSQDTAFHYGTDLAANSGDDIRSFAAGTVAEVGQNEELGRYLRIDHADGFSTLYGHCSAIWPAEGQYVSAGEKIAMVGDTGQVTGPNLHFELTRNGTYLNPEFYLSPL